MTEIIMIYRYVGLFYNKQFPMYHIDPFWCLHFARIHYTCASYWQEETKQSFFPTAPHIRAMASATTYSSNLNSDDRKKYEEKLITADGTVSPDPYTLLKNWKDNVKFLLDITWTNIYNDLINTPSLYTNEKLTTSSFLVMYTMLHIMELTICQNSALLKLR